MLDDLESGAEISKHVDRLLRKADAYGRFPTPVDDIVAAAGLQQADDYVFDDSFVSQAPAAIRSIVRGVRDRIMGLVDRRARVIHISPNIEHDGKRRFIKLHETVHEILPYQQSLLFADDNETLSSGTKRLFEKEANQGAAEFLFQGTGFAKDASDLEISIPAIWGLATRYGSSFHAAVRRYAETHDGAVAAIVLECTPRSNDPPTWARQECLTSRSWITQFGPARWPILMDAITYPFLTSLTIPSLDQVPLADVNGSTVETRVETYQTPYSSFVLLWVPQRRRLLPRRKTIMET
ncbi:hypothetical protein GALL_408140 [mine drainage metagenome]|uniref:IrrE N-terminal-like domain-containing protein n=1 Tax=mine drainage metagenome TaxID=410659 RepID=A0A1J5QJ13_9ZZZZ